MKKFAVICAVFLLSGSSCTTLSRDSSPPPTPAQISAKLKQFCGRLIDIPDRDLTRDEMIELWKLDRQSHGACIRKDDKLVKAAEALEKQGQRK
ncbi:hypothetical protein [Mesorhizobium sp. M7A.F.Ca.MR.362.00.0.0]|uniref:hypothetical protein n=1 Tax=Mesorhizobium sp. M7A.F.Ca.MR.362.00.0.0 TaxID=2496779 RepID=UPI000FD273CE|nr:hypothetical protein [Mesorhizobium sp. M7A.F.Ca.MR.362.00.0.0]RUU81295.1 hypothetical protein EOC06_08805 [Mesorhizobium sp. M7A.F.Ca.MR.362.00.0.0]